MGLKLSLRRLFLVVTAITLGAASATIYLSKRSADTRLLAAVLDHDASLAEHLIKNLGADPSVADRAGASALFYAVLEEDAPMVALLVELGADVNAYAPGVPTPLEQAVALQNVDIAEFLLSEGASPAIESGILRGGCIGGVRDSNNKGLTAVFAKRGFVSKP